MGGAGWILRHSGGVVVVVAWLATAVAKRHSQLWNCQCHVTSDVFDSTTQVLQRCRDMILKYQTSNKKIIRLYSTMTLRDWILERSWVALSSVVCQASVSPDQISTFSNIYRHTSPLLTMYHLISSSTNLYWPSTSQYRHILTQYHQVCTTYNSSFDESRTVYLVGLKLT